MSQATELANDLREIINCDVDAQVSVSFCGKNIVGTRGNIISDAIYDRDGGGENTSADLTTTFILSDWPTAPIGDEVVALDGQQKRIKRVIVDDYNVALVIDFTTVTVI